MAQDNATLIRRFVDEVITGGKSTRRHSISGTIGERTRDALRHKRGNGERLGNIGFGYRLAADGLHFEPDPVEQAAPKAARKLRAGGHSLRAVAAALNQSGHRTRRGTPWRLESVAA
jgi:site-specific DNA recombinase